MQTAVMAMLKSVNPATNAVVGTVKTTPVESIDAVVARSREAQRKWAERSFGDRAAALGKAAQVIESRSDELAKLLTEEMGKPLREAMGEILLCSRGVSRELEEIGRAIEPEVIEDDRSRSTIYHDPFGVCAAITPWNFPFSMPHWLVFPALATGNTVVLKPSEETPLIAQAYADCLNENLDADVLQVVHGADEQGKALVAADVDLIAFTGSREVGKAILKAASSKLKRVILELGGKDPLLVLADADLARTAKFAASSSFRNAGQVCVSTERIFVHREKADTFVDFLCNEAKKFVPGNGLEDGVRLGPMINRAQRDRVLSQVRTAIEAGAELVLGSTESDDNFLAPIVLRGVRPDMGIAREETFGPVACVIEVEDDDEAVALANDTPFGLGAVVFGEDPDGLAAVVRRLTAGMIGLNSGVGGPAGSPWVGAKESGYGFHSSPAGHRQFTQTRMITARKG
jgi:succinate-semialdehyde dehydrogenase/glutarate-semialdehyde dehydrogenase